MTALAPIAAHRPAWLRRARQIPNNFAFAETDRRGSKLSELVHDSHLCRGMGMQNAPSPPVDETAFANWLATAAAGERLVYHVGHLGFDRCAGSQLTATRRKTLNRVACRAFALAEIGQLFLIQHRVADGCVAYLAIMVGDASERRLAS